MFTSWCVGVSVRIFFINFLDLFGGFNVMMQKFYFVFAAALLHKVDLVMLSMQKMKFTGEKRIPFSFHPAPRFVKEC